MELLGILLVVAVVWIVWANPNPPTPSQRPKLPPKVRYTNKPNPTGYRAPYSDRKPRSEYLPPIPADLSLRGKAYIIDGDTIRIGRTKIRLAGVDAPEIDMPWGQKSKWAMVAICKGQVITAELDGERSFDRLVGTCFLPDGRDIGAEIIKQGLALDCPHFSGGKYQQFEPEGARQRLANGRFGHSSIKRRLN